jgi:hypothetical protein
MQRTATFLLLFIAGCTTAVVPQAQNIRITRNMDDIAQCKIPGTVEAQPPFVWPGDDLKQLKNKAAPLGADTVFVTNRVGTIVGVAYRCRATSASSPSDQSPR